MPPVWSDAPEWVDEPVWADDTALTDEPLPADAVLPVLDDREAGIPLVHVDGAHTPQMVMEHPSDLAVNDDSIWTESLPDTEPFTGFDAPEDLQVHTPASGWAVHGDEHARDSDDVVVGGNGSGPIRYDPEIDDYILAPDVPRMCRTCAAFRPAEDGERGWCSNGWAFNNRLLVGAWEVPCQTSFGNWWIPNDDHWNDGILERLNSPAPLFDQLMAQRTPTRREKPHSKKRWS